MKNLSVGSYQSNAVYQKAMYGKLAKKSFEYEGPEKNPVIVIHGFLGAKLFDENSGKEVWGKFDGIKSIEFFSNDDLKKLSHPMEYGTALRDLKNGVTANGLLDKIELKVLGMSFHLSAYDNLINILKKAGYSIDGKNKNYSSLFIFDYDWRRDLSENAVRLHKFILEKKKYLQTEYKRLYDLDDFDVQFDFVAHSMGGLLSRYYLRYGGKELPEDGSLPKLNWDGSKHIDKLVIVGTPNAGYLDTCTELINGFQMAHGTGIYPPAVIGTFPTYYQMMPLPGTRSLLWKDDPDGAPLDIYDPEIWKQLKWGLADPKQDKILKFLLPDAKSKEERLKISFEHLSKCLKRTKQFSEAMKMPALPPDDVAAFLFCGDAVPTSRTAVVDRKTGKIEVTEYEPGDGKVLTSSAIYDKRDGGEWKPFMDSPIRWKSIYRMRAAHLGITSSEAFADNLTYCLLSMPTDKQLKMQNNAHAID